MFVVNNLHQPFPKLCRYFSFTQTKTYTAKHVTPLTSPISTPSHSHFPTLISLISLFISHQHGFNRCSPRVPSTLPSLQRRPRRTLSQRRNRPIQQRLPNRRSIQRRHHQPPNRPLRPPLPPSNRLLFFPKLPLLIYIHGGAFCVCSPANPAYHSHLNTVSAEANIVVVSVDYRLAPEHPLPIAYDDSWEAVQWAAGASEPWIKDHADLGIVFFAGDSAGANLAHNVAIRGGTEGFAGGLKLQGMVLLHPYFGGEERDELVAFLYPTYGGVDDLKIHAQKDPKLLDLGCPKVLVFVAGMDLLKERGKSYYEALKKSGWSGSVELVETEGENHVFHLFDPTKENSAAIVKQFVSL
ncbi:Lipase, GDXG, putative serine active site [Sesbania bispinosa]|nr:Lipase, GDXG, putative serine active site [Sesbania bispinosa]